MSIALSANGCFRVLGERVPGLPTCRNIPCVCALGYWIGKIKEWERQRESWLLTREFDFPEFEEERLNAPGKPREVIRNEAGRFTLGQALWGFERLPGKSSGSDTLTYNARSETVNKLPLFQDSFESRRCLLVGTAFCEGFCIWAFTTCAERVSQTLLTVAYQCTL